MASPLRFAVHCSLFAVIACDGSDFGSRGTDIAVRDSAGITITTVADEHLPSITLGAPLFTIGGMEASEAEDPTGIVGAVFLDDGFVVFNSDRQTLHRFDFAGRLVASGAGRGDGPGELLFAAGVVLLADDSLVVTDWGRSRLEFYRSDLVPAFTLPLDLGRGSGTVIGSDGDSGLIVEMGSGFQPSYADSMGRAPVAMVRVDRRFTSIDTIHVGLAVAGYSLGVGWRQLRLTPNSFRAVDGKGGWIVVEGTENEVRRGSVDAGLRSILRIDRPRRSVDAVMRAAVLASDSLEYAEAPPGIRWMMELDFANPIFPDSLPAIDRMVPGRDGTVWVREGTAPSDSIHRWIGVSRDSIVGSFTVPASDLLLAANANLLLFTRTDADGLGYLEMRQMLANSER